MIYYWRWTSTTVGVLTDTRLRSQSTDPDVDMNYLSHPGQRNLFIKIPNIFGYKFLGFFY